MWQVKNEVLTLGEQEGLEWRTLSALHGPDEASAVYQVSVTRSDHLPLRKTKRKIRMFVWGLG